MRLAGEVIELSGSQRGFKLALVFLRRGRCHTVCSHRDFTLTHETERLPKQRLKLLGRSLLLSFVDSFLRSLAGTSQIRERGKDVLLKRRQRSFWFRRG